MHPGSSASEGRCARTSTLPLASLRSRGSGAAAALSNYGWPLARHVTLNGTTNLPGLFHILKN